MNAIAVSPATDSYEEYPRLHLSGDEIKEYLGDFSFEKDKRYAVELEFTVDGWNKNPDGTESITLCIKSGGEAQEVGSVEEPKPDKKEKKADVKVAKVTVKEAPVETY